MSRGESHYSIIKCFPIDSTHAIINNYSLTIGSACGLQFFSDKVARTMKHYADKNTPGFKGCEETVKFIKMINELVDAMNSRLPSEALYANKESKHYKVREEKKFRSSSKTKKL